MAAESVTTLEEFFVSEDVSDGFGYNLSSCVLPCEHCTCIFHYACAASSENVTSQDAVALDRSCSLALQMLKTHFD